MNHTERLKFAEGIFEQCLDIMRTKGLSYASQGDAAENFKRIAEATGMTKYQVWAVYFGKHVLSLNNAVKRNPELPAVADGEPIAGRVADIINYAVLLAMMVEDDEGESEVEIKPLLTEKAYIEGWEPKVGAMVSNCKYCPQEGEEKVTDEQTIEIVLEVGYLMGRDENCFSADSDVVIPLIIGAAKAFAPSKGVDRIIQIETHAEKIYQMLLNEGMVGNK